MLKNLNARKSFALLQNEVYELCFFKITTGLKGALKECILSIKQ